MSESRVLLEMRGDVALLTLNAPERRNAIDLEMVQALHARLDELERSREIAAVVLTGAGAQAFASGADIAQLRARRSAEALSAINSRAFLRVEELPVPTIAAIRGFALGGGCELALACDLRVAGRSAKMGQPEVKLGIIPAAGGTYRLPRVVGAGLARELIFTGRILDAEQCLAIRLVNHVVDDDQVVDKALAIAAEIAANGRLAVRLAKQALNALGRAEQATAVTLESSLQALLFDSDDKEKRMSEFLAKSKAKSERK
jgi:enoyl-CoA hydratase